MIVMICCALRCNNDAACLPYVMGDFYIRIVQYILKPNADILDRSFTQTNYQFISLYVVKRFPRNAENGLWKYSNQY